MTHEHSLRSSVCITKGCPFYDALGLGAHNVAPRFLSDTESIYGGSYDDDPGEHLYEAALQTAVPCMLSA